MAEGGAPNIPTCNDHKYLTMRTKKKRPSEIDVVTVTTSIAKIKKILKILILKNWYPDTDHIFENFGSQK